MKYQAPPPDRFEVNISDINGNKTLLSAIGAVVIFIFFILLFIKSIGYLTTVFVSRESERALVEKYKLDALFQGQNSKELSNFVKRITMIDYPFDVKITDIKNEMNAYCFFGDKLMVTQKLLQSAESENELAFVLAHEVGHSYYRHNTRGLAYRLLLNITFNFLGLSSSTSNLSSLTYSRDLENQADDFAIKALKNHYGHTLGAADFFKRVRSEQPTSMKWFNWLERIYSTHPMIDQRIERIVKSNEDNSEPNTVISDAVDKNQSVIPKSESSLFKAILPSVKAI